MIKTDAKLKIIEAIKKHENIYASSGQQARVLGISPSQLSRLKKEKPDLEGVLSDEKWMLVANVYDVDLNGRKKLEIARTDVFNSIWKKLEFAQKYSVSGMIFDRPDIGKTQTAKLYVRENRNAVRIHCGRVKTKQLFIRAIARECGINNKGRYIDVFDALVNYLNSAHPSPLIILDEYGDMNYESYLEHKSLWNETEGNVGWIAMGAEGVERKIERYKDLDKVGFAELFSRLGNRYQRITPVNDKDFEKFQAKQIAQIGKINGATDIQKLIAATNHSLRRIPVEMAKMQELND
jgi:hypothetical protein